MLPGLVTSSASRWSAGRPASVRGSRAVAITRWPRRANSAAAARPIPFDAPVISTDAMTASWVRKRGNLSFQPMNADSLNLRSRTSSSLTISHGGQRLPPRPGGSDWRQVAPLEREPEAAARAATGQQQRVGRRRPSPRRRTGRYPNPAAHVGPPPSPRRRHRRGCQLRSTVPGRTLDAHRRGWSGCAVFGGAAVLVCCWWSGIGGCGAALAGG